MSINTNQLWVVEFMRITPSVYSYDTTAPSQVFLNEHDAIHHCINMNNEMLQNSRMKDYEYQVFTLSDRMDMILSNAHDQGVDSESRSDY